MNDLNLRILTILSNFHARDNCKNICWQKKELMFQKETAPCVYHKAALIPRLILGRKTNQTLKKKKVVLLYANTFKQLKFLSSCRVDQSVCQLLTAQTQSDYLALQIKFKVKIKLVTSLSD